MTTPRVHHIGVQTPDMANSLSWYRDFFGCLPTWSADKFSDVTLSRLPGVVRITELLVDDLRFHLIERDSTLPGADQAQFQHVCLSAGSGDELRAWHQRWTELYESGKYTFARPQAPTDIVVDEEGVESFYCVDVNGLEFEFTYVPGSAR